MQETGRAGRDKLPAQAILYHNTFGWHESTTVCRREMLIKHFNSELKDITMFVL